MREAGLVACFCFDLGGAVRDWRRLVEALREDGWPAGRFAAGEEALQAAYRVSHSPVLLVADGEVELELPIEISCPVQRIVQIYPSGVLSFRYHVRCVSADAAELYATKQRFRHSNKGGYVTYLKDAYGAIAPGRLNEMEERPSDFGILLMEDVNAIRTTVQHADLLQFRPGIYFPVLARYLIYHQEDLERRRFERSVARLAEAKGLAYPANDLDGLIDLNDAVGARITSLPGMAMASWEGFETFLSAEDDSAVERAIGAFELVHHYSFLCGAWIEILDNLKALEAPSEQAGRRDIEALEQRLLYLAELEQQITQSMIEVDSGDVMLIDPVQLQLVLDFRQRFFLERAKRMVFERLDALDRQTTVIRDVLDRNFQEGARRQAEHLQLIFGGAVAASITALIPATSEIDGSLRVLTWVATGLVWLSLVLIVLRLLRFRAGVTLQSDLTPGWVSHSIASARSAEYVPDTPQAHLGTDRGQHDR